MRPAAEELSCGGALGFGGLGVLRRPGVEAADGPSRAE